MISMTTARRHPGDSPRRHRGALVVALFNESPRGDEVAELAVLNAMGGRARAEGPRSEATEPTIVTAYGSRKPTNSAARRCGAHSSHAQEELGNHRSRSAGGCMRSAGRNKFNVCWAGLGACSGIFSRRSSHGVRAARYTARDVVPVVTRGTNFNADRLTDSGLKHEIGPAVRKAGQGSTAQPGGRRLVTPACVTARSPALPALAGFSICVHGSHLAARHWDALGQRCSGESQ